MSRYIVKAVYLEKPKRLIIWNRGSTINHSCYLFKCYLVFPFLLLTGQWGTCAFHDISVHRLPIRDSKGGRSTQRVAILMCFFGFLSDGTRWPLCIHCMYAWLNQVFFAAGSSSQQSKSWFDLFVVLYSLLWFETAHYFVQSPAAWCLAWLLCN